MQSREQQHQGEVSAFNPALMVLVRLATLAPSPHNSQPWKFLVRENTIRIFPDLTRRLPVVDPDNRELYIGLGCALENLVIGARGSGYDTQLEYQLDGSEDESMAVHLSPAIAKQSEPLQAVIPERQSTRTAYDGKPIPLADLNSLVEAGQQQGVFVQVFTAKQQIRALTELVKEGCRYQFSDPNFVHELISWLRFNSHELKHFRDGLDIRSMGLPETPTWLARLIIKRLLRPELEADRNIKGIQSSSALIAFSAASDDKEAWVAVGRSYERVALKATSLKIRNAHLNMVCEVPAVREQFRQYLGVDRGHPMLLLRLGYAKPVPFSTRRAFQDVLL